MKVKDLINELAKRDYNAEVVVDACGEGYVPARYVYDYKESTKDLQFETYIDWDIVTDDCTDQEAIAEGYQKQGPVVIIEWR